MAKKFAERATKLTRSYRDAASAVDRLKSTASNEVRTLIAGMLFKDANAALLKIAAGAEQSEELARFETSSKKIVELSKAIEKAERR